MSFRVRFKTAPKSPAFSWMLNLCPSPCWLCSIHATHLIFWEVNNVQKEKMSYNFSMPVRKSHRRNISGPGNKIKGWHTGPAYKTPRPVAAHNKMLSGSHRTMIGWGLVPLRGDHVGGVVFAEAAPHWKTLQNHSLWVRLPWSASSSSCLAKERSGLPGNNFQVIGQNSPPGHPEPGPLFLTAQEQREKVWCKVSEGRWAVPSYEDSVSCLIKTCSLTRPISPTSHTLHQTKHTGHLVLITPQTNTPDMYDTNHAPDRTTPRTFYVNMPHTYTTFP